MRIIWYSFDLLYLLKVNSVVKIPTFFEKIFDFILFCSYLPNRFQSDFISKHICKLLFLGDENFKMLDLPYEVSTKVLESNFVKLNSKTYD